MNVPSSIEQVVRDWVPRPRRPSKVYVQSMADYASTWRTGEQSKGVLLTEGERLEAYLKACAAAPQASAATKRKWKRRLGL